MLRPETTIRIARTRQLLLTIGTEASKIERWLERLLLAAETTIIATVIE